MRLLNSSSSEIFVQILLCLAPGWALALQQCSCHSSFVVRNRIQAEQTRSYVKWSLSKGHSDSSGKRGAAEPDGTRKLAGAVTATPPLSLCLCLHLGSLPLFLQPCGMFFLSVSALVPCVSPRTRLLCLSWEDTAGVGHLSLGDLSM